MTPYKRYKRPIIGVYVNRATTRRLVNGDYDPKSYPRIISLAKASIWEQTTLYFFSRLISRSGKNSVTGTYYDKFSRTWKQKTFPQPDILYSRRASSIMLHQYLDKRGIIRFNAQPDFNKWKVYERLHAVTAITHHFPKTVQYNNKSDLIKFLDSEKEVYLKGHHGGRGNWIFRVRKMSENKLAYSYFRDKLQTGLVNDVDELLLEMERFYVGRPFLMQSAIDMIHVGDSKVDFRAELQRDGRGNLKIVGIAARIGISGSPITIHSSAYPIEVFFKEFLYYSNEKIDRLMSRIKTFLFAIYTAIEKTYGTFGEIGIDFGIDKEHNIWFIEPNSKSTKISLMKAYDEKTFNQAFLNPVQFCKYLYKQKIRKRRK
ncbi:YheC/YheD family protein [Brevibacillus brevis]|uniref:YheC/YheD family protein n=1 Tax=Brevibacillus brevis TaxID=1393 RepID=UPI001F2F8BBE|nr:YheC/YheD family protein [Brevibacillus brevis]UIO40020.1 YheC/YheD family protein [Brevibacillus brevis]